MKKSILSLLLALWLCLGAACALAAPQLSSVFADDSALVSGQDGWYIEFETSEGGATGETVADLGSCAVEAGAGRVAWDGLLPDGSAVPAGDYMVAVQVKNFWGEESGMSLLSLHIYDSEAERDANRLDLSTLMADDAQPLQEPAQEDAQQAAPEQAAQDG